MGKVLFDDDGSGLSDDGMGNDEIELKVNQEYAKRFRHNKERDELMKLEEKYKGQDLDALSDSEEEESSEEEDEFGELITEEVEEGINKVLDAIRNNKKEVLLNKEVKFFDDAEEAARKLAAKQDEKHKPIYLKDYHRMNLLEESKDDSEEKPFVVQQREERSQLISEIHEQFKGEDEDGNDSEGEDGFLTKRTEQRKVEPLTLTDPEKDGEKFLNEFISQRAWIPREIDPKTGKEIIPTYDEVINSDAEEDDDVFDDAAEQYEAAYNFRFEDPNAAEIISYARNKATMRRKEASSRQKAREEKKKKKSAEKLQREREIARLKTLRIRQVADKLEKVKEAFGDELTPEIEAKITAMMSDLLLSGNFSSEEWDERMEKIFNEEFYEGTAEKPKWDDDIDIDDIVGGDEGVDGKEKAAEESEAEDDKAEASEDSGESDEESPAENKEEEKISGRKAKLLAKKEQKKVQKALQEKAAAIVEANMDKVVDEVDAKLNIKKGDTKFMYREVEPESFGLTTKDILFADDKALNQFIGLKKFAPYRDENLVKKDKRKYAKARRLREWRKEVFRNENGPTDEYIEEFFAKGMEKDASQKKSRKESKNKSKDKDNKKEKQVNDKRSSSNIVEGERKKKRRHH